MSYDLMVFNSLTAPRTEQEFLEWYKEQTKWEEDHSYDDPRITSNELRNWFMEMINEFPTMNGPYSPINIDEIIDDENITDYSIGKHVIYTAFSWSIVEKAYPTMLDLAQKHRVGFYDASGDGNIMIPNQNGILVSVNKKNESNPWWKFWV